MPSSAGGDLHKPLSYGERAEREEEQQADRQATPDTEANFQEAPMHF